MYGIYRKVLIETDNGTELICLTKTLQPDILFVDMEIVETTGIEAARNIRSFNTEVIIIFVAASEKYLKEAFELYAYDYMLKPLQHARIRQSINRILHIKKQEDVTSSISTTVKRPKPNPKLLIESNGKSNLVNIREIIFITRYERKIVICYRHGKVSFWNSFEEIKKILTDNFFCSHKGYIINVDYIKEIIPYGKKTYEVTFYGSNETALMTAEKVKLFREKYCLKL